jgi:hypothetical protein
MGREEAENGGKENGWMEGWMAEEPNWICWPSSDGTLKEQPLKEGRGGAAAAVAASTAVRKLDWTRGGGEGNDEGMHFWPIGRGKARLICTRCLGIITIRI